MTRPKHFYHVVKIIYSLSNIANDIIEIAKAYESQLLQKEQQIAQLQKDLEVTRGELVKLQQSPRSDSIQTNNT